ncbi:GNAT family N-acetyltransferase (plasmid) [Agrobacterium tumefaciens]|uniref:GNAT family N-acetyltransferase n=1 Tax=Agrobacterium TaxID=357 RepID=UPI001295075C|nr:MULTISPECIES: GNAT family N-acetyltransferase [Agrobacterium]MQB13210.1 N-acetyltransferase [Agrobacterium sp. ICMP 6402]NSZ19411.1 GNAT family N-acetyltransferase [Agrobacterium vitis]QZO07116.1 GNAT family N-acetyltransferase [Agrobacterium vitis]UJL91211.1 GNAT family N-acetyltransferase [Agrobacterium vitis]UXT69196.1 GNAT family N-acetyltransferase [Agrobacterium tumefaciens]
MTDPSDVLKSFQTALSSGEIRLQRCELNPEMYVLLDHPNGEPRFTYVTLAGRTVTALAMFVVSSPIEGVPCFHMGYAVPEAYRNQGRAKRIVEAAIAELKNGFSRANIRKFHVEAVIGEDNHASRHVAEVAISKTPIAITDEVSGLPAFHYVRKVD